MGCRTILTQRGEGSGQRDFPGTRVSANIRGYRLDGWTVPDLINPDDVNLFMKKFR